jgi:hypothetical protein
MQVIARSAKRIGQAITAYVVGGDAVGAPGPIRCRSGFAVPVDRARASGRNSGVSDPGRAFDRRGRTVQICAETLLQHLSRQLDSLARIRLRNPKRFSDACIRFVIS